MYDEEMVKGRDKSKKQRCIDPTLHGNLELSRARKIPIPGLGDIVIKGPPST